MNNLKNILFTCILIPINLCAQSVTNHTYNIILDNFKVGDEKCGVEVSISNIKKFEKILDPLEYSISINLSNENDGNYKITIKGKKQSNISRNIPACSINQEIYINEVIAVDWKKFKNRNSNSIECYDLGLKLYDSKIELNSDSIISNNDIKSEKLILKISDENALKIIQSCEKLLKLDLKRNLPCTIDNGKIKTYCDENYYQEPNNLVPLDLKSALIFSIKGDDIRKGVWENKDAKKTRLIKAESEKKIADEKLAELERKRQWLDSPEGKKFLIDEEIKNRKKEEKRNEEIERRAKFESISIQADKNCTELIKDKWEFDRTNNLGQRVVRKFSFIGSYGPYDGGGKYGKNIFWEFKLKLEDQNSNQKQFTVDCVFDSNGKILGLSDPKNDY